MYSIAHVFEASEQAARVCLFGASTEVVCAEVLIDGPVPEHVVDGGEHGGGDGADCFLRPASAAQTQVLGLIIASAYVLGGAGALNEGGLEPAPALGEAGSTDA